MRVPTTCPDPARLRGLLDGRLSSDEQADLTAHLDGCPDCQRALEDLAAGSSSWPDSVRHREGGRPGPDSAYWAALKGLQRDVTATVAAPDDTGDEELSLDFLSPADRPGTLGKLSQFDVVSVIGRGGMG